MASWEQQALAWGSMVGFGWILSRNQSTVGLEAEAWTNAPTGLIVSTCQDFKDSELGKNRGRGRRGDAGWAYIEKFHPKLDKITHQQLGLSERPEWATIQIQRYGGYGGHRHSYSYTPYGTKSNPTLTIDDYEISLTMGDWILGEKMMGGATKKARTPKSVMKKLNDRVERFANQIEDNPTILGNRQERYKLEGGLSSIWEAVEQLLSVHHFRDSFPKIACATYESAYNSEYFGYYTKIPDATAVAECIASYKSPMGVGNYSYRKSYAYKMNNLIVIRRDTPLPTVGELLRVLQEINKIEMKIVRRQGDEERNVAIKEAAQEVVRLSGNWYDNQTEDPDEFSEDSIEQTLEAIRRYIKDRVKNADPYDDITGEGGLWWH